jgi:hypothetical protein
MGNDTRLSDIEDRFVCKAHAGRKYSVAGHNLELLTRRLPPTLKTSRIAERSTVDGLSGATAMPQFDPELIGVMKKVLEDIMTRVPLEHSTPAAKAYFAECILKAAARGQTSYDALIVAAADQIEVFLSLFS